VRNNDIFKRWYKKSNKRRKPDKIQELHNNMVKLIAMLYYDMYRVQILLVFILIIVCFTLLMELRLGFSLILVWPGWNWIMENRCDNFSLGVLIWNWDWSKLLYFEYTKCAHTKYTKCTIIFLAGFLCG